MTKAKGSAVPSPKGRSAGALVKRSNRSGQVKEGFAISAPMPGAGFLAKVKLKKSGGSLVMTVPAAAKHLLSLVEGQEMTVMVDEGRVVAEPVAKSPGRARRPKYTLAELLVGYEPAPPSAEELAWHNAAPVGREVW
jgi:antitoxin ChpS